MSTSSAKRQRLEAASNTLSKPFRSPFKDIRTPETNDHSSSSQSPSPASHVLQCRKRTLDSRKHSIISPLRRNGNRNAFTTPTRNLSLDADPEASSLLKEQRDLESQLRELKEELNIAEQAKKIEEGSKKRPSGEVDGELSELIRKWKGASRMAADELFTIVRDRVNRMGGSPVWREMRQNQMSLGGWNESCPQQSSDDEIAEDGEGRNSYTDDFNSKTTNGKEEREANKLSEDNEDDEFTMVTMLKMLNVDLSMIGYDREHERWKTL